MAYVRCDSCSGRKVICGLGMMEKTCYSCKGTGFQEDTEESVIPEISEQPIIKRRGRKPKLKEEVIQDGVYS